MIARARSAKGCHDCLDTTLSDGRWRLQRKRGLSRRASHPAIEPERVTRRVPERQRIVARTAAHVLLAYGDEGAPARARKRPMWRSESVSRGADEGEGASN